MRVAGGIRHVVLAALLGLAATAASAQEGGPPQRQPPHEEYAACDGRQAGEACSVTIADRTLTGTCTAHDNALACRPDRPPHEPPPEAFAACASLTSGAACSVAMGEHQLEGTCEESPDERREPLAAAKETLVGQREEPLEAGPRARRGRSSP